VRKPPIESQGMGVLGTLAGAEKKFEVLSGDFVKTVRGGGGGGRENS
jgi:hypothetical protein